MKGPSLSPDLFDYPLPAGLIAQRPAGSRRGSRLMHLGRASGEVVHLAFADLPRLLRAGDLLVLNDTRVFRARLSARRASGGRQGAHGAPGGGDVELFLLKYPGPDGSAPCLLRPAARVKDGEDLLLSDGTRVTVRCSGAGAGAGAGDAGGAAEGGPASGPEWTASAAPGTLAAAAEKVGRVPLPPYIRRGERDEPDDAERYQTVFAHKPGAVAAPTAGLHFDDEMLDSLHAAGVESARLTLHVGAGTFFPVRADDMRHHRMHEERYEIPASTAAAVARAKGEGRRVVAVGTTVVRALESAALVARAADVVHPGPGATRLLILPGFEFKVVDALLTNFHLPKSTLLALVSAFAVRERVLAAYAEAVRERYRFFSYGDAMFIS